MRAFPLGVDQTTIMELLDEMLHLRPALDRSYTLGNGEISYHSIQDVGVARRCPQLYQGRQDVQHRRVREASARLDRRVRRRQDQ